jgi:hypothetical protein
VLSCVGDNILQEFNTVSDQIQNLQIAKPRRGGGLRQAPAAKILYRSIF